jgi:hypothetical protein
MIAARLSHLAASPCSYGFGWYLNELGGRRIVLHGGGPPGDRHADDPVPGREAHGDRADERSGVNAEEMAHVIGRFYISGLPPYEVRSTEHPPRLDEKGELISASGAGAGGGR